jgi:hypothetical protein
MEDNEIQDGIFPSITDDVIGKDTVDYNTMKSGGITWQLEKEKPNDNSIISDIDNITDETLNEIAHGIVEHETQKKVHVYKIVKSYTTREEILDSYDGLFFFNMDLQANGEAIGKITQENIDAIFGFQKEMHFVNKMLTIQKYYSQRGDFYKQRFKGVITNPKTERDELGIIERYGVAMSVEEFDLFDSVFNELFKIG